MFRGSYKSFIGMMLAVFLCALMLIPSAARGKETEEVQPKTLRSFIQSLDFSKEQDILRRFRRAYVPSDSITDINGKTGEFTITGSGLLTFPQADKVLFALWSAEDQSDLHWYEAKLSADGSCRTTGNVANHKHHFGKYQVHMYVVGYDGSKQRIAAANAQIKGDNYIYTYAARKNQTAYVVRIANPNIDGNPSDHVKAGIWSNFNDKDDLKWYPMKKVGEDLWETTVRSAAHKHGGVYNAHIYCGDKFLTKTQFAMKRPEPGTGSTKMIALTFDDGPGKNTGKILAQLKKYKAHATFFVVGPNAERYPKTLKAIMAAGCEIGNHSYHHSKLGNAAKDEIQEEISSVNKIVKDTTGKSIQLLRPPYGDVGDSLRQNAGMPMILWSIDSLDWKTRDTEKTIDCIMENAQDGDIVLMHDIHDETVAAAIELIPMLEEEGFQLVTVSELASAKGEILQNGIAYGSIKK